MNSSTTTIQPFRIAIPDPELELLQRKLALTRLPANLAHEQWGEGNGVTIQNVHGVVDFWRRGYDWRAEEAKLNELPQYTCDVKVEGFGKLAMHFVHQPSSVAGARPLLFVHGWPGSFAEVVKMLPMLNDAGFHVVAPSLPGYGFSACPDGGGFTNEQDAEAVHNVMLELGYRQYVAQGGDWGSDIVRNLGRMFPQHVQAVHVNHVNLMTMPKPHFDKEPAYTAFESRSIAQQQHFATHEFAYFNVQSSKPRTLGIALHDSPVGMLAWMMDKLYTWSDDYPWSPTELITWTLLHYFPGPTTPFHMYRENSTSTSGEPPYESTKMGVSAFGGEMEMVPRSWVEGRANVRFWREHERGGHFAAWEKPEVLGADVVDFFDEVWKGAGL